MRCTTALALLTLGVFALPSAVAGGIDGPYVTSASHEPAKPAEGENVIVTVHLADGVNATSVFLTHCRVDPNYACSAKSGGMTQTADGAWTATIPWQYDFFQGTTWVGYNVRITHANDTESSAPLESVPATPEGLPEGAGHYYFYEIDSVQATPGPGLPLLVAVLTMAAFARRRP